MDLFEYVGRQLRRLRADNPSGHSYSQEALANALRVAPNTISRWETATYRPTLKDLDKLARVFGVSILEFFPREDEPTEEKFAALLRTAKQLDPADLDELRRFAEFRKAERLMRSRKRQTNGSRKSRSETL